MSLENVCLEQQEIIGRQNMIIAELLRELALHRALSKEEADMLFNYAESDNKETD